MSKKYFEGVGICSFATDLSTTFQVASTTDDSQWTEIKLSSSGEDFATVQKRPLGKSETEDDFDIPYAPLSEMESEMPAQTPSESSQNTCEVCNMLANTYCF